MWRRGGRRRGRCQCTEPQAYIRSRLDGAGRVDEARLRCAVRCHGCVRRPAPSGERRKHGQPSCPGWAANRRTPTVGGNYTPSVCGGATAASFARRSKGIGRFVTMRSGGRTCVGADKRTTETLALVVRSRAGRLFLANVLDSLSERLVSESFTREFFSALAVEMSGKRARDFPIAVTRVCLGKAGPRTFVRSSSSTVPGSDTPLATHWTSLISMTDWAFYHCRQHLPDGRPVPAFPPAADASSLSAFADLIRDGDWIRPDASGEPPTMGVPGMNCWVSTEDLDGGQGIPPSSVRGSGLRVADAAGLPPKSGSPFDSWVRCEFIAEAVEAELKRSPLRPTFADLGNAWFRVRTDSPRAAHYAACGWGSTVNLTVVRARRRGDTGRPERVMPAIPLRRRLLASVTWLPQRTHQRQLVTRPLSLGRFRHTRPHALNGAELLATLMARLWP
jgi:hypothetical protein